MSDSKELAISERSDGLMLRMKESLSRIDTVDQAMEVAGKAKAFQAYAKTAGQSLEMLNDIAETKLRAEREAGKILIAMEKKSNQHGAKNAKLPALSELGVTRMQSSRLQAVARVQEEDFERYCKSQRETGQEITQLGLIRLKSRREDAPREKPHFKCPSCGLRSNRCIETGDVVARVLPRRRKCLHCNHVFRTWEMVIDPRSPPEIPIVHDFT